jgi:hypothetical protein
VRCDRRALAFLSFRWLGVHGGSLERFLRLLKGFGRVLHGALGLFVAGEVVLFAVAGRRGAMGVRGELVHFRGSDMKIP